MRNNLIDEMIADYTGITAALGRFRADWLLRFYGLESFPVYRQGGRLKNYRGEPPLSDPAFSVLQKMVIAAAKNLERFDHQHVPKLGHASLLPALLMTLTGLTIVELASEQAETILAGAFARFTGRHPGGGQMRDYAEIAPSKI